MSNSTPFQQPGFGSQTNPLPSATASSHAPNQAFRRGVSSNPSTDSTAVAGGLSATHGANVRAVPTSPGAVTSLGGSADLARVGVSGGGGAPTRLDQISGQLAAAGFPNHLSGDEDHTLLLMVDGEPRFRLVAPPDSHTLLLIADVFSGQEQEIGMMAPSLLHANFTCQRMSIDNELIGQLGADPQQSAELQALPVMGLDLERMMVVLTLQILAKRLDEPGFTDFMVGLIETISQDTEMLVTQFRTVAASALP